MTIDSLGVLAPAPRSPSEQFRNGPEPANSLLEFWTWAMSDLLVNTNRGLLAEFLVARALGDSTPVRDPWRTFDVVTDEGIRVEVKSAAYLQAWAQKRHSDISFSIPPTTMWDADSARYVGEPKRHAQVYVFALMFHREKESVDPADLSQWSFYAVPTSLLDAHYGKARSITLKGIEVFGIPPVPLADLKDAVRAAAHSGGSPV